MLELSRTIRFSVDLAGGENQQKLRGRYNTFAGWPTMVGLGAYYELDVVCRGQADVLTGYIMNISAIDRAVREHGLPLIEHAVRSRPQPDPGHVLAEMAPVLQPVLQGSVHSIRWRLTPYYSVAMSMAAPDQVLISQQFEFSASHRLHVPSLSDRANRETFGKCNNPNSHGHNYRIEPMVAVPLNAPGGRQLSLPEIERIVDQTVIQRFDHKHLNLDTKEFAELNPSVENIAKVLFELLGDPISAAGGRLVRIRVWETEKTSCTYPASAGE